MVGSLAPQRVVVTGAPGPALETFAQRTADALDVPLVPLGELTGPDDLTRLASFEGWVTTGEYDARCVPLLERAEALVHLDMAPTTLTGRVKRTLKRVRAEATPPPDRAWLAAAATLRPDLGAVLLTRADEIDAWLRSVSPGAAGGTAPSAPSTR